MSEPNTSSGDKKRKWPDSRSQHGGRGRGNKGANMGRNDWSRQRQDRRSQTDEQNVKRQKVEGKGEDKPSVLPAPFSKDEISAEERKPKHKVAVLIGYSGSGYKGMQINAVEKTIEGDLFSAFVAVGAISKANANDPKKSALVRCARTDKGVHAAGNVISLKLIVEDPDIVAKINEHLSPQIRIWGIQRTVNSFSCYQACDSRWYEYLIPTHAFLPPHPSSFLGRKLVELAEEVGDLEAHRQRQEEVAEFWAEAEEKYIKPILEVMDESIKEVVVKALYDSESESEELAGAIESEPTGDPESATKIVPSTTAADEPTTPPIEAPVSTDVAATPATGFATASSIAPDESTAATTAAETIDESNPELERKKAIEAATRLLRQGYLAAKRAYRIDPRRLERVASALKPFLGTHNFHNYTVAKPFRDPSAKRLIKSFNVNPTPLIINGTEWLSIKIHGQSFMMHQIRKMISMIALTVRNGCPIERISETFEQDNVSIPKVPGLGLLLERPVFESYNEGAASKFERPKLDFSKFEKELEEFKQREIYERIFREEEQGNAFHTFFNHVDAFREPQFLYVSSKGIPAIKGLAKGKSGEKSGAGFESEDEDGAGKAEEG